MEEDWDAIASLFDEDFDEDDSNTYTAVKLSTNTDEQSSDSEMDIPLSKLKKRSKKRLFSVSDVSEDNSFDDEIRDLTFVLSKAEKKSIESDSEDETLIRYCRKTENGSKKPRKKKEAQKEAQKQSSRTEKYDHKTDKKQAFACDKYWKKKSTTLSRKKQCTPGRPAKSTYYQKALKKAKMESFYMEKQRRKLFQRHTENLDNLLKSNGLQRRKISGDENCFFQAVITSIDSVQDLRAQACKHLADNFILYKPFLTFRPSLDEAGQMDFYNDKIRFLEQEGHWSDDLADCLPLVVSNVLNRTLKIYCSNRSCPVMEINPTAEIQNRAIINLAYIQVPGQEHYDACDSISSTHISPDKRNETPKSKTYKEKQRITPRKQAQYTSPKKIVATRKRKSNPDEWKKNIRKNRRLHGLSYISVLGKEIEKRKMKPATCKCRFKCIEKISEAERADYFKTYWELSSYERQRDFICANITEVSPVRIRTGAKKHKRISRAFSFEHVRVCKDFFLKTLDIGERVVENALKQKHTGTFSSTDKRGRHTPHNKTPDNTLTDVRNHIESFPTLDAHYTRQDTRRKFLGQDLNITKMYSLYKEKSINLKKKCVSRAKYRQIFCSEYNYSFHVPKKDQCLTCVTYHRKEQTGEITSELNDKYKGHCKNKERAREEKNADKTKCKESANYHVATFDLQAVLPIPCSLVSQVYYKRKLSCYNLSFYSLKDSQATCYLWNESEGQRGSCEIGTCLLTYIKSLPNNVDHITFYSDCCSGQNRNKFTTSFLLHAVNSVSNIKVIDHKFLETGHTQMESDSIHAAIETAKKCTNVYVPSQWDTVVRLARRRKPYTVVPLKYFSFFEFKTIS